MPDVLAWVMERRVVLSERVERLRKELAETEAEVARLETAEVVFRQFLEDRDAGHPDQAEWDAALEEATGGEQAGSVLLTPGAGGVLLVPHRAEGVSEDALPEDYRKILGIVAAHKEAVMAKDIAVALGKTETPAQVEPVRGKLKRLAERGWLHRTPAGRYCTPLRRLRPRLPDRIMP